MKLNELEFTEENAQIVANMVGDGDIDYDILYHLPASENYPWADEVAMVRSGNFVFRCDIVGESITRLTVAIDATSDKGVFPAATRWMVTDNDAIDYGMEA